MSKSRPFALVLILGLALATWLAWPRRVRVDEDGVGQLGGPPVEGRQAEEALRETLELPASDEGGEREVVALAEGMVVDEAGQAIVGAQLSWGSRENAADVVLVHTGESGRFVFAKRPQALLGRLVVTAIGFAARTYELTDKARVPDVIVLARAGVRTVRVVDSEGKPLAAVDVRHRAERASPGASVAHERKRSTGTDGSVRLAVLAEVEEFRVERNSETLLDWVRRSGEEVRLVVPGSFEARGRVRNGAPQGSVVRCEVVLDRPAPSVAGKVESAAEVDSSGAWGPVELPCAEGATYRFHLTGPSLVPELVVRDACPGADRTLQVDFEGDPGGFLWFELRDLAEERVWDGTVRVAWSDGDEPFSVEAGAREKDGYIQVTGIRPGAVVPFASAPGCATMTDDPILVPEAEPTIHVLYLYPETVARGRVTYDGEPVSDFVVNYWNPEFTSSGSGVRFREREDGRFEIPDCPAARLEFIAQAEGLGSSRIEAVDLSTGADIELRLTDARLATGRVIDRNSGEPLSDARVHLAIATPSGRLLPLTEPLSARADGTFLLEGLPHHAVVLIAEAPEHSALQLESPVSDAARWEAGDLSLSRSQDLTLELEGHGTNDPETYAVRNTDGRGLPPVHFGADGKVTYPNVGEGTITLQVTLPSQEDLTVRENLWAGKDWVVPVHVGGAGSIDVVVVGPEDVLGRSYLQLKLSYDGPNGRPLERFVYLDQATKRRIEGLPRTKVSVLLFHADGNLASKVVDLGLVESASIELEVGVPGRRVRVVDRSGRPVAGALVRHGRLGERTDPAGEASLLEAVPLEAALDIEHPELGVHLALDAHLSSDPDTVTELVFDPNHFVEVVYQEAGEPISGLRASLGRLDSVYAASDFDQVCGADGRVRWDRIGPGRYRVASTKAGYFYSEVFLEADTPVVVPVRRTCDLTVRVAATGSGILAGVRFDLHSLEFDQSVESWATRGILELPTGCVTDALGTFTVVGLPEGPYRWTATTHTGASATGETILTTDRSNTLIVEVP